MSKYFKFVKNDPNRDDCNRCEFYNYELVFCADIGCGYAAIENNLLHKYAVKITKSEAAHLIESGCKIIYRGNNNG